jgi:GNAT superfamily N-acetyltransferase
VIRPFRPDDARAATALLRKLIPEWVMTDRGLRHWVASIPERSHPGVWVAEDGGEVVGWGEAFLQWDVAEEGVAYVWFGVYPQARRRGLGSRFYELATGHLRGADARRIDSLTAGDPDGERFLLARGFRRTRSEQAWSLDPNAVDLAEAAEFERRKATEGYRLVPLREARDRPEELFQLFSEAHGDVPSDHTHVETYEDWRRTLWDYPDLDFDGSHVVFADERPVAFAWIAVDREGARGTHVMTGTAREFRNRGLARLAKLGTIRWAAGNGVATLLTENDSANRGMLALNDRLGYRPTRTMQYFAKDVGSA